MFSNNSFAKIKEVEDKGNYAICRISISQKRKDTGAYDTDFIGKVRFVGKAYGQHPMQDQRIKITSCGVSNCFTKNGNLEFLKVPTYTVFDYELQSSEKSSFVKELDDDMGDLPF